MFGCGGCRDGNTDEITLSWTVGQVVVATG